ncbi:hypothetical protein B0H17DRAFT_1263565 [Mycena rosella]|uniref:Uncharacterized protein n=1 Tax=Mycena rosella TaxID=1033263 RepID=A0AAD7CPM5_MYCRO|nr:hypothetical protein B0H17DRAFT_1263565 [Mycena rosella]
MRELRSPRMYGHILRSQSTEVHRNIYNEIGRCRPSEPTWSRHPTRAEDSGHLPHASVQRSASSPNISSGLEKLVFRSRARGTSGVDAVEDNKARRADGLFGQQANSRVILSVLIFRSGALVDRSCSRSVKVELRFGSFKYSKAKPKEGGIGPTDRKVNALELKADGWGDDFVRRVQAKGLLLLYNSIVARDSDNMTGNCKTTFREPIMISAPSGTWKENQPKTTLEDF